MSMQNRFTRTACAALALVVASGLASATSVGAGGSGAVGTLTDLGLFAAGTYQLTGAGVVDLVGDGSFLIAPNGTPVAPVSTPGYGYFNPSGSYLADGNYGAAGTHAKIGALIGSSSATPTSPADWFLIGDSDVLTLGAAGHLYASVNDTFHDNDTGSFMVEVSAVPEPASIGLILGALALFAAQRRRRA
jgi:hypothetical protein